MDETEGDGTLDIALLVQKVHVHGAETVDGHLCLELGERVHPFLLSSPIKLGFPVLYKTLDVGPRSGFLSADWFCQKKKKLGVRPRTHKGEPYCHPASSSSVGHS